MFCDLVSISPAAEDKSEVNERNSPATATDFFGLIFFRCYIMSCRGVTLTPHPLLLPWSSKSRAIPLLPLCSVRTVRSLSACTRVTFTFIMSCALTNELNGAESLLMS